MTLSAKSQFNQDLQQALRAARDAAALSQSEAARAIGCTPQQISHWECGRRKPGSRRLRDIARAYNCSADWLLRVLS